MANSTMRRFKWFWPWQDQREEAWLAEMSMAGWHLLSMAGPAVYAFVRGEPKAYVYRLDWQDKSKSQLGDYVQLFQDAGWERVLDYAGWHYFRTPARTGEQPEIYTDADSKIARYRRLLIFLCTSSGLTMPTLAMLINLPVTMTTRAATAFMTLLFLIELYVFAGLWGRIRQLKKLRTIAG